MTFLLQLSCQRRKGTLKTPFKKIIPFKSQTNSTTPGNNPSMKMEFKQHFMLPHQQPVQLDCCLSDSAEKSLPGNSPKI